jgi:hypothetical protein
MAPSSRRCSPVLAACLIGVSAGLGAAAPAAAEPVGGFEDAELVADLEDAPAG